MDGRLFPLTTESVISKDQMKQVVNKLLRPDQKEMLAVDHQVDTSVEYEDLGVLRINIFKERGKLAMANRIIGSKIPAIEELWAAQNCPAYG